MFSIFFAQKSGFGGLRADFRSAGRGALVARVAYIERLYTGAAYIAALYWGRVYSGSLRSPGRVVVGGSNPVDAAK